MQPTTPSTQICRRKRKSSCAVRSNKKKINKNKTNNQRIAYNDKKGVLHHCQTIRRAQKPENKNLNRENLNTKSGKKVKDEQNLGKKWSKSTLGTQDCNDQKEKLPKNEKKGQKIKKKWCDAASHLCPPSNSIYPISII